MLMAAANGDVWGWGLNIGHALGMDTGDIPEPQLSPHGPQNVRKLLLSGYMGVALTWDGTVYTWGTHDYGKLGRPDRNPGAYEPLQPVSSLPPVASVFAGVRFSVAVDRTGKLYTWGSNAYHALGLNGIRSLPTFTDVGLPPLFAQVEVGQDLVLARTISGQVYSWGNNRYGQLGRTTDTWVDWNPAPIPDLSAIVEVAAGADFAIARDASGHVHSWGYASQGALGDGTSHLEYRTAPNQISSLSGITSITAGTAHVLAVDSAGGLWAWGSGSNGALGLGDTDNRDKPQKIDLAGAIVQDIAAGLDYSLFLADGNTIGGCGLNVSHQLSNRSASDYQELLPVDVMTESGLKYVFAGTSTGFAVNSQGNLWAWGGNGGGIKGCCPLVGDSPDIVQVRYVSGIGHNQLGQLGIDRSYAYAGPVEIPLTGRVTHVSTSGHTSALIMDGRVYVSGSNAAGLLTRTPLDNLTSPRTPEVPRVAPYPGH